MLCVTDAVLYGIKEYVGCVQGLHSYVNYTCSASGSVVRVFLSLALTCHRLHMVGCTLESVL